MKQASQKIDLVVRPQGLSNPYWNRYWGHYLDRGYPKKWPSPMGNKIPQGQFRYTSGLKFQHERVGSKVCPK
jgi:hypothetical protein